MFPRDLLTPGALALGLAFATVAGAQDAPAPDSPAPVELPEQVVRVPPASSTAAADPTAAATIVEARRYEGEAKGVAELLAASPGVEVTRYGIAGQLATVSVRGVAADAVKVLVDGLPLGGAGGGVDLATIPRAWISRVEVIRGPVGAELGAGAMGGAVNVVTRGGGEPETSAELTGGSFGTWSLAADRSGRAGALTYFVGATAERASGDFTYLYDDRPSLSGNPLVERTRLNDGARRAGLILKLGGPLGALDVDGLAEVSGGHRELPGQPNPTDTTTGDWSDDGRALAMVRFAGRPSPTLGLSLRLHGRADLLDTRLAALGPEPTRQRGGAGGATFTATLAHGPGLLTVAAAAELEGYTSPALGGARVRPGLSASIQEEVLLAGGRLRLGPALRVERTGPYAGVSARVGVALRVAHDLTVRASAGRTYRVPSFAETWLQQGLLEPNPELSAEVGLGADAAIAYDGPLGVASIGGHATRYDDLITYEPASLGRFKPFNTGRALAAGLEAEAATVPAPRLAGLSVSAAYTLLHTEVLRGPPGILGNDLPRRPRHRLYARAGIAPGPFGAHVEARVLRHQFEDRRNYAPIPDQTVFSAGASVRLLRSPRLSLHVELDNLAGDRSLTDGFGYPLPGRTLMVSLRTGGATEGTP
ncbi:TonB-dependent receptor plug domain-containing protein [Anaeromyxobacter oryzae]|uniref:TonB-dependent vitamin B12 receptor n=1 Tax=Anaeromyxobacter oryzae TaxID=2918170 RepID=A0ABM7WRV8_9BACT|nr:TonB-dependent receptor [Anaeromyxobacter oryzae]BDG02176.1 TonB-dependent vitamin B12 receptor [Anaeromyxobacter oryzae]